MTLNIAQFSGAEGQVVAPGDVAGEEGVRR